MQKYVKVYRDHYDPGTGLRWFSADRVKVKRRFPVEKLPGILLGLFAASYIVFWIYWAITEALPRIIA